MQFIDDAAAESDGDEDGRRCRRRVKRAAGSDDEKEEGEVDSDEETEQDRAFINDDSSEEEDEEEDAGPSRKRTRVSRTLPEVDSDDLALLRENAGEPVESGASSGETGKCCCVYADSDEDEMSESDLGFVVDSDADPREARHVEGVLRKFREQSGARWARAVRDEIFRSDLARRRRRRGCAKGAKGGEGGSDGGSDSDAGQAGGGGRGAVRVGDSGVRPGRSCARGRRRRRGE
jgi:hypothetical protein